MEDAYMLAHCRMGEQCAGTADLTPEGKNSVASRNLIKSNPDS